MQDENLVRFCSNVLVEMRWVALVKKPSVWKPTTGLEEPAQNKANI